MRHGGFVKREITEPLIVVAPWASVLVFGIGMGTHLTFPRGNT
jgi:hypothetical protein